jgi:hypothetical protein
MLELQRLENARVDNASPFEAQLNAKGFGGLVAGAELGRELGGSPGGWLGFKIAHHGGQRHLRAWGRQSLYGILAFRPSGYRQHLRG